MIIANQTILIIGASSRIATELGKAFGRLGYDLFMVGRDLNALKTIAADLNIRHQITSQVAHFDADSPGSWFTLKKRLKADIDTLSGIIVACGSLGDQRLAETNFDEAQRIMATNFLAPMALIDGCLPLFSSPQDNFIIALTSVSGDRGRQSNYYYGAAKAGFNTYLQGLRNRLHKKRIRVLTVKLGFVDTKMSFGHPGMFAVASPKAIATHIMNAWRKRKDQVYLPAWWRYIMFIIRSIPERIFKTLSL